MELFFGTTKLFQSKDEGLRRLTYLLIKELCVKNEMSIIVVASLTKDMNNSTSEAFKSSAIRVLCRLVDGAMLGQIERHLKQAIVDKAANVSSAALVSGLYLLEKNPDLVRRWTQEVYDAVTSKNAMSQYHALGLYHEIKQNDKLSISKLVQHLTKYGTTVRSSLAHVLLIRYTVKVLDDMDIQRDAREAQPLIEYLEGCLRHKSEVII